MGCGSGIIGLSLARHYARHGTASFALTLADISSDALEVCRKNINAAELQNSSCQIHILQSNLFDKISDKFDIIVANLPYIASAEIAQLAIEVKEHDPLLALNGGTDGLDIIRKFCLQVTDYLTDNGKFYLEIGSGQYDAVQQFIQQNIHCEVAGFADIHGLKRFIYANRTT